MKPDWQAEMVAMIRGAAPLSGELYAGSATLTAEEQIAIYAEQFRLRLWDAFAEEVPGYLALAGDAGESAVWAFLDRHPPSHWSLGRVADGFADWLASSGAPAAQVEMARLDHAVMSGFLAAAGTTPRPEQLAEALTGALHLRLQPHVHLLVFTTSVQRTRSVWSERGEPPGVVPGDFRVAVYRVDRAMRHVELEAGAYAALVALRDGGSIDEAVMAAVAADPTNAPTRLSAWFASFVERGLVEVAG